MLQNFNNPLDEMESYLTKKMFFFVKTPTSEKSLGCIFGRVHEIETGVVKTSASPQGNHVLSSQLFPKGNNSGVLGSLSRQGRMDNITRGEPIVPHTQKAGGLKFFNQHSNYGK